MKDGRSIQDLAKLIDEQAKRKTDFVADTRELRIVPIAKPSGDEGDKAVAIEATNLGRFPMRDLAMTQACNHTGLPVPYARKMLAEGKPDLLATNLNRWFTDSPSRRLVRTLDGLDRALLSDRYQRIDNIDVAGVVLPIFADMGLTIRSCEATEHRLYIKASLPSLQREIKSRRVNDLVEAGVMVTNSEVGLGAVGVTDYAFYLACLNGMVREKAKRWNHVGRKIEAEELTYLSDETLKASDKVDLMMVRDAVKHALSVESFEKWVGKIQDSTEQRVTGNVAKAIEVLSNKLTLSSVEGDSILKHLIEGGDISRYGLMNAVTRTAEDAVSYDRATELEAYGQRVIDLPANDWREISEAA